MFHITRQFYQTKVLELKSETLNCRFGYISTNLWLFLDDANTGCILKLNRCNLRMIADFLTEQFLQRFGLVYISLGHD